MTVILTVLAVVCLVLFVASQLALMSGKDHPFLLSIAMIVGMLGFIVFAAGAAGASSGVN